MSRAPRPLLLAVSLLLVPTVVAAQDGSGPFVTISPPHPTTLDLVEVTIVDPGRSSTIWPAAVEVGADGVIRVEHGVPNMRSPGAPSFVAGPLAAGTYTVELTRQRNVTVIGEFEVLQGAVPAELGTGVSVRRVAADRFEVTVEGVPGTAGSCPYRVLVLDEVRYEGPVVHVFLRDVTDIDLVICEIGSSQPSDVKVALTLQQERFYSVAVWLDEPVRAGTHPMRTFHLQNQGCAGDPETFLCLGDGRFVVGAAVTTVDGPGQARPVPLTADTGAFWFFRPDNLELTVKVLDACATFGRYWVFISGLTNQGVEIGVLDVETGERRSYRNHLGDGFEAIRDTNAFATCDAGS